METRDGTTETSTASSTRPNTESSNTERAAGAATPENLVDALVHAAFVTTAVLNTVGAEQHVSLTQMRVLGILRDRRLRMSELARFLGLEKSTLSGLVDRAAARGLVERAPSATDRRAVEVFLSPAGREMAERTHETVARELEGLVGVLDDAERDQLRDLLAAMLTEPQTAR